MSFVSETLKKSDIENKFSVPSKWLDEYWPNAGNGYEATIRVWHQESLEVGKWHDFVLTTRNNGPKKTEFKRKGWLGFVKGNNLKEDDVVHFGKRGGESHFTIIIERNIA